MEFPRLNFGMDVSGQHFSPCDVAASRSPACRKLLPSACSSVVYCADKRLMGREMLSLKDPKQMFSENEDIVLEQRPTVQVNRARVCSTTLTCICYCKRQHVYSSAHNSIRFKK